MSASGRWLDAGQRHAANVVSSAETLADVANLRVVQASDRDWSGVDSSFGPVAAEGHVDGLLLLNTPDVVRVASRPSIPSIETLRGGNGRSECYWGKQERAGKG